jgi:hypothetical protein
MAEAKDERLTTQAINVSGDGGGKNGPSVAMPVGQHGPMNEPNEYTGLRHSLRLWLCRTLLGLTRRAYEPYPIAVIVRRTVDDPALCDGLTQESRNDGLPW